ncbi:MAG: hydantoinase/oxoprolinase family protein [Hyphomicrobiaceae bacterium]
MIKSPSHPDIAIGIDVGGTFTDIFALDRNSGTVAAVFKLPSTPDNPANAAVQGVDRFVERTKMQASAIFHGTTVGTNTLIEKRGAITALITTKGFRDVLALRRQARPRLYDMKPVVSPPLTPRALRFEANERILFDGSIEKRLTKAEIERLAELVRQSKVEAVAISLLHAYANDAHECLLANALRDAFPNIYITRSSDVSGAFREFERTSTTTVNGYIGPAVAHYVESLESQLRVRKIDTLSITKSNGGLTSTTNAKRYPVHLIESGPAAGVIATATLGRVEGRSNLIAFDMGGTTAKAGVIVDGEPRLSTEFHADQFVNGRNLGGYPITSPAVDIIEIGSGGGSVARLDSAGVIKVGPESTGAAPGPAAYGKGGEHPTVTDAHVVLGHIAADGFANEDVAIFRNLAEAAIARHLAEPLGWSIRTVALGILRLANANMAEMVRLATLRRGLDPRDFALVAFGGAGPLHAAEIARDVGIPRIIIPAYPGLFSAIGTILGEYRHDLVQTYLRRVSQVDSNALRKLFHALEDKADTLMQADVANDALERVTERNIDLRFEGQLFELTVSADRDGDLEPVNLERHFRDKYIEVYGFDLPNHVVEIVNLRLVARAPVFQGSRVRQSATHSEMQSRRTRQVWISGDDHVAMDVVARGSLSPSERLVGPVIIEDFGATIRVLDGQVVTVGESGSLSIGVEA